MQLISPSWHCERNTRRGPSHRLKTNLLHFAALLLIALSPRVGWAQQNVTVTTFSDLKSKLQDATTNYSITLGSNVTWDNSYNITVRGTKTLQSDNTRRTISRTTGNKVSSIVLMDGASLTVTNVTFDGNNDPNCASMILVRRDDDKEIYAAASLTMTNCTMVNCLLNYGMALPSATSTETYHFISSLSGAAINFSPSTETGNSNPRNIQLTNCVFNNNRVTMLSGTPLAENISGINALDKLYCNGGAIGIGDAIGTDSNITGCTFTNNKAAQGGGALYFENTLNEVQVIGCTIGTQNNPNTAGTKDSNGYCVIPAKGGRGGGIYFAGGKVKFQNTKIEHNLAYYYGGGIYIQKSQSIKFIEGTNNNSISNNKVAESITPAEDQAFGGGIYVGDDNGIAGVDIQYTNIYSNKAWRGGGIFINGENHQPAPVFSYCNIGSENKGNEATRKGGGIYLYGSQAKFYNCKIQYNYTTETTGYNGKGGGIYKSSNTTAEDQQLFQGCDISYNGCQGSTTKTRWGGGVYIDEYPDESEDNFQPRTTFSQCDIHHNKASEEGGGLYLKYEGIKLQQNKVYSNESKNGGGIYMKNGKILGGSGANKIYGNTASNNGGGIYYQNGTIQGNNYVYTNEATNNGGGVYVEIYGIGADTDKTFDRLFVGTDGGSANNLGNRAVNGGGIYIENNVNKTPYLSITFDACSIVHNKVQKDSTTINQGGGVYMKGPASAQVARKYKVNLAGGTIIDDNKANNGGGVYVQYNGGNDNPESLILELTQTTLSNNEATTNGGGIYNNMGKVECGTNCSFTFDGNEALAGGGIYNEGGTLTLNGSDGGQIFKKNKAFRGGDSGGNGGGIYLNGGEANLTNCDVGITNRASGNEANNGGGIYNDGTGSLKLDGTRVSYNTATQNGGGIFHNSSNALTLEGNTTFLDNEAVNGGGLYNSNGKTTEIESATFTINKASHGGGIYNKGGTVKEGDDSTVVRFVGNEAINGNGGGIHNFGTLNLNGTGTKTFAGNKANDGGGIYNKRGTSTEQSCMFEFTMYKKDNNGDYVPDNDPILGKIKIVHATYSALSAQRISDTTVYYDSNVVDELVLDIDINGRFHLFAIYKPAQGEIYDGDNRVLKVRLTRNGSVKEGELIYADAPVFGANNNNYYYRSSDANLIQYPGCFTYSFHQYNTSSPSQPAVYTGVANLSNCTIGGSAANANKATNGHGGGIYIRNNSTVNLENSSITNNEAARFGGGVYICTEAIMGVKDVVTVSGNTSTRTTNNAFSKGSAGAWDDDVCLQTISKQSKDPEVISHHSGKIKVLGDIADSRIGITEEEITEGTTNVGTRREDEHGDYNRQFTIDYYLYHDDVTVMALFFSNDKILDVIPLYGTSTNDEYVTTTGRLEVTLGLQPDRAWYVAGIVDDNGLRWGDDDNSGLAPDVPCRTLTGQDGIFARGYNPNNPKHHVFVVRSISIKEEALVRTTEGTEGTVVIRYPKGATSATFNGNNNPIYDADGSYEVRLHRYPGGHKLSTGVTDDGSDATDGPVGEGRHPGPNLGPIVQMNAPNETILRNIEMDGLSEYDGVHNESHNPATKTFNPTSAVLAVEKYAVDADGITVTTTKTDTITLKEECRVALNNNKDGINDNSESPDDKREKRPGGGVYNAGTLIITGGSIVEENKSAFHGGGIYIKEGTVALYGDSIAVKDNEVTHTKDTTYYGGGVYIDTIASMKVKGSGTKGVMIQHNTAKTHGGGVYKLGTLQVEGLVTITENTTSTSGTKTDTDVPENVYIPYRKPVPGNPDVPEFKPYIEITEELACSSSIGVTKTKKWMVAGDGEVNATENETTALYGSQGEHVYDKDDNFKQVRTEIAKVHYYKNNTARDTTWALYAFGNNNFFDDKNVYGVWSFNYSKTGAASDTKYSDQSDYFIETWRSYADKSSTNWTDDGNGNIQVKSNKGLAYLSKYVNDLNGGDSHICRDTVINQIADIDLSEHYWEPIGLHSTVIDSCSSEIFPFSGTYDGRGHTITGAISILPVQAMGLFGYVMNGTVKRTFSLDCDFTITRDTILNGKSFNNESTFIEGSTCNGLGGIVGFLHGYPHSMTMDNSTAMLDRCEAHGKLTQYFEKSPTYNSSSSKEGEEWYAGASAIIGGLVGAVDSYGQDARRQASLTGITNSFAVTEITGIKAHMGGLVGGMEVKGKDSSNKGKYNLYNSYSKADFLETTGRDCYVGSLVGAANVGANSECNINNCYTHNVGEKLIGGGTTANLNAENLYAPSGYNGGENYVNEYTPTIGADQLGYMYADNLVSGGAFGGKPLFEALSIGAERLNGDDEDEATENTPGYRTYDRWARPALAYYVDNNGTVEIEKPINGDLPVLLMDNYGGADNKVGQGGFRAVSTVSVQNEGNNGNFNGYVLQYSGPTRDETGNTPSYTSCPEIDGMLDRSTASDCHFIYGDVSKAPSLNITANRISIYEHAAITQAGTLGSFDKTHVSITFDNSSTGNGTSTLNINDLPAQFLPRDWHLLSTPLNNAPIGFNYYLADRTTNTNAKDLYTGGDGGTDGVYFNNPWQNGGTAQHDGHNGTEFRWLGNTANTGTNSLNRYWMKGWTGSRFNTGGGYASINLNNEYIGWKDGYFPSTFDNTLYYFNQGCSTGTDEKDRYPYGMDFYSWTEPNYHYINFKRNGPNHWHSDPNPNGIHEHLDYTPETSSNYASPTKNVNEEILLAGKGYFASIAEKTLLQSSGQLGTSTSDKTIEVTCSTYPNTVPLETGWNLVGNPFHAYLDFDEFSENNSGVNDTYIVYNADGFQKENEDEFTYGNGFSYYVAGSSQHGAYASQYLHPHQGFFVKVGSSTTLNFAESQTVLRSQIGTSGSYRDDSRPAYPLVNLFLTSDKGCSDVCVVEFNRPEWGGATKLRDMYSGNGLFYAAHDNGNYAALFATPEAERIPLKFEAKDEAGDTYTIHWNTQNGDFRKLYLVDNITGVQYDMLRNSSYSFSGKKGDYWSRFYITFEVTGLEEEQDDEDDDDSTGTASTTFAFFDGSQWVVTNEAHGTATLDLIDLQGRVLHSTTLAEGQARIGLPDLAKGMYLMRMTNQNGMFVQKIVVR